MRTAITMINIPDAAPVMKAVPLRSDAAIFCVYFEDLLGSSI